jgi:hypothetical protein
MKAPDEVALDYTMLSRRWSGVKLITAEIAVEFVRLVHRQTYGQSDLEANEPLNVSLDNDAWLVLGSKHVPYSSGAVALDGPLEMRISQYDGQILSYLFRVALTQPKPSVE